MKKYLLVLFFFFSVLWKGAGCESFAQKVGQLLVDSLEQELARKNLPDTERVNILAKLAWDYRILLPAKATRFGLEAEALAKKIHHEVKLGEIYLWLCYDYLAYNDMIKAYEYSLLALKYNTEYNLKDLISYSKLAILYINPNLSNDERIKSTDEILPELNNIHNKELYVKAIGSASVIYVEAGLVAKSDSLVQVAINESKKNNFQFLEMHNRTRLAADLFFRKQYETAIPQLHLYIAYMESIGAKRVVTELLSMLGDSYLDKFYLAKNKLWLDSAEIYTQAALQIASTIEYQEHVLTGYFAEYKINKERGDLKKAISFLEKYNDLNDSLYGAQFKARLENITISQQDEIANGKLRIKETEISRQRIYTYAGMAGIGLALLSLFFVYRNFRNQKKANDTIAREKKRSDELLLNILPSETAEELKITGTSKAKAFTMVTVMFTDFKDFTSISEKVSAELLVDEIHTCFSAFDNILQKYKIEKIKTIGDAYLCASGLPVSTHTHAQDMLNAAFEIRGYMLQRKKEKETKGEIPFELRIGIHTGPVVAGVVGVKKYAYDIWGDTVNIAARMEQNSEAGKINISGSTYELVKDKFNCSHRGKIEAKNKGEIDMYFVESSLGEV